jgi:hypothetical protein
MTTQEILLEDIKSKFLENTGITLIITDSKRECNRIANIRGERFIVEAKPEITQGNKGIVLQQLKEASREENLPVLLVTKYIPSAIVKAYVEEKVSYIDTAGNCNIYQGDLLVIIEGKKIERLPKTNQPRAFQEAGIKLIFCLLDNPVNMNKSFRELSDLAQIALGSVSMIFKELIELKFVLKTKNKRLLKNVPELLQRWVIAYNDVLRPKLLIKKMNFSNKENHKNWESLDLTSISGVTLWGGECAAHILTKNLFPAYYTIYTNDAWQAIGKSLKLVPDDNGKIEILRLFYSTAKVGKTVSPLLVYADLMGNGDSRNLETAEILLNNELQYLKR